MNVTFNKRTPIYLQVIQHFKRLIVSEELKPGEEMPSRRQLANQLKINPNTVQKAYSEMEEQRLIYTEPNRPSKITENPNILNNLKKEWLNHAVNRFVSDIKPIGISLEELTDLIEEEITTREKENK